MFDSLSDSIFEALKSFLLFRFGCISFDSSQRPLVFFFFQLGLDVYFPDALSSTNTANANPPAPQIVQSGSVSRVMYFHREERNLRYKMPPGKSGVYVNSQARSLSCGRGAETGIPKLS